MNVMAVGAHFDDIELGCSGALIKHILAGDSVTMVVITKSGYSNPQDDSVRTNEEAAAEGKKGAEIIGAELISLDYPVFEVPFNEELTRALLDIIESRNIDTIYSHWVGDLHRDHSHAGRATLMAGRHVPRFLMYRSNFYLTEEQFRGNFYVDITSVMEQKLDSIRAHNSELQRVGHAWIDFTEKQNANDGQIIGVNYAESFELIRYLQEHAPQE